MKYLCFDRVEYHTFPAWRSHKEEAALRPNKTVTSAGHVRITNGQLECYGESTTLKLKAAEQDTQRINAFMRGE